MKKTILIFVLVLAACSPLYARDAIGFVPAIQAEATPRTIVLQPGESVLIVAATQSVPVPPTVTPAPPTETPVSGVVPDINVPYCEDIGLTHDPHAWHPHWNAEAGCFWSEFHGDDPNTPEMVAIFGELPYPIFGGPQSSSPLEHIIKHRGDVVFAAYEGDPNWITCHDSSLNVADGFPDGTINDCIVAYRLVLHADDIFPGFLFTDHGYKVEMKVCSQESGYDDCGIIRNSGHAFFANFRTPFYTERDFRPGGLLVVPGVDGYEFQITADVDNPAICSTPTDCIVNDEPYVQLQHPRIDPNTGTDWLARLQEKQYLTNKISWSSGEIGPCTNTIKMADGTCRSNYIRWSFQAFDAGVVPDESNLLNSPEICFGQEHCAFDNSKKGIAEVGVYVDPAWDMLDGVQDNHITGRLWVDRYQQPKADQATCLSEHLGVTLADDCFAMDFEHYPISPGVAAQKKGPGSNTYYITEYNQCQPDFDCKVR